VLNAAGIDFTISSRYWDLTNYAMFNGIDPDAKQFAQWIFDEMKRLECGYLLSGECGHGYRGLRWELANWLGGVPFKFSSMMELMAELIQQGKLKVDKSVWAEKRFTYHDSCNIARSGGVMEEPRTVIRAAVDNFVEMEHNREESFAVEEAWRPGNARSFQIGVSRRAKSRLTKYGLPELTWCSNLVTTARTNSKR
jgi:Fe-S oxidoreductase